MIASTMQFITEKKLRELRRQREKFRNSYQQIHQTIESISEPSQRMRRLYEGLRELQFANQPLHPEVVNLELALRELEAGCLAPEVTSLWQEQLEKELAAGQLRSEFIYLFGALLEEWAREGTGSGVLREQSQQEKTRLLEYALTPPEPNDHIAFFASLLQGLEPMLADLPRRVREKRAEEDTPDPLNNEDLECIAKDIYQPPRTRTEAKDFLTSKALLRELSDALMLSQAEWDTWDWQAEGVEVRSLWTHNKWRLFLDSDLPTVCLLESLAAQWSSLWQDLFDRQSDVQDQRNKLRERQRLNVSPLLLEETRRLLEQAQQMAFLELVDNLGWWTEEEEEETDQEEPMFLSVQQRRQEHQYTMRTFHRGRDYDGEYNNPVLAIQFLNAEIQLARAAFPDRPLYVVKGDIKDFYPSIPHDALLTVLKTVGMSEADRQVFQRFLSPPLRAGEDTAPVRMQRGVPTGFSLSTTLAELLLRFLDRHIQQRARVQIIRLTDDICLLASDAEAAVAGWNAIEEFCRACGLQVNHAKSGAVCLGGTLPEGLPSALPRWGMLELDATGGWSVHQETFQTHLAHTREQVLTAASLFAKVQRYNANLRYLLDALALKVDLGETHRQSVWQAAQTFHGSLFGASQGIVAHLGEQLRERFQVDVPTIPDSWLYWPLTAGGLGLQNPLVTVGQFAESWQHRTRQEPPQERTPQWATESVAWASYYRGLLTSLKKAEPQATRIMKTLTDDFIERGQKVSAGQQQGLSSYWQWILYTYGPQILQMFGDFRFLIPELVPMQLINEQRLQDSFREE